MAKVVLIDLSVVHRRHWHATEHRPISEAFQRTVTEVHDWASQGDHVAVCIDMPPYIRKELFPGYKAQREAAPEQMHGQLADVVKRLEADGLLVLGARGYEGDDIIATACAQLGAEHSVVVISGDKDVHQLLGPNVTIIKPATGERYDAAALWEKAGIKPEQVVDYLAIIGDKSDNIEGVKGVGPVNAAKWLRQFGTLEAIIANATTKLEPERLGKALLEAVAAVRTGAVLIKLRTDAPVDVSAIFKERTVKPLTETPQEITAEVMEEARPETALVKVEEPSNGRPPVKFELALEPMSLKQAGWLAEVLFNGRIFGAFPNKEAVLGTILTGRVYGLDAVTSLRSFHNINGKQTMSATLIVGLVKRRTDICKYFSLVESSEVQATWETHRIGEPTPTRMTYTIDEAKRAKLVGRGGNWEDRPKVMLRHRAATELARAVFPDIVAGLYSTEEVEDARQQPQQ